MSLLNLRKIIITSRFGPTLFFAIPFFIAMLFVTGVHKPISLLLSAVIGIMFGLVMSSKFRKNNSYFIENIKSDHYSITKKYNKLFKEGRVPDANEEQAAYLKYLDGLQKLNNRSVKGEYAGLGFLTIMFFLSLVVGRGISLLNTLFGFIIILSAYGFIQSRKNLKKIEYLKKQIHLNS